MGNDAKADQGRQLSAALRTLAAAIFPTLNQRPDDGPFSTSHTQVFVEVLQHPVNNTFSAGVLEDPELSLLFRTQTGQRHDNAVYRTTGTLSTIQLELLAPTILLAAWRLLRHRESQPTKDDLKDQALAALNVLRSALRGDPVTIPAYVGLTGILLPPGAVGVFESGRIREANDAERRLGASLIGGRLQRNEEAEIVEISYGGDAVVELDVPFGVRVDDAHDGKMPDSHPAADAVQAGIENLRLGLLLASPSDEDPMLAFGTWHVAGDPLDPMSMAWRDPHAQPSNIVPRRLTPVQLSDWTGWIDTVEELRTQSIDVAITRLLRAVGERQDPVDALVDSAIVWENLVGSRQGETTLRVSAALAWLLGRDPGSRAGLHKAVADLYDLRSRAVHGGAIPPGRLASARIEATALALRALRAVLLRPALLKPGVDSTKRSRSLILQT